MNVLSLRWANLRTFEGEHSLTLPEGCTAIVGRIVNPPPGVDNNGAGKSTVAMVPELALFGKAAGLTLAEHATRHVPVDYVMAEATVEHQGRVYRVRRTHSLKGRGKPSLDFEVLGEGAA